MKFARFKAVLVACLTLAAAALTTPAPASAAPVASGWQAGAMAGPSINGAMVENANWRRRRAVRGHSYAPGYSYGPARVYRRAPIYRPAPVYRPRCTVVYRRVWTMWGHRLKARRVCY